MESAVSCSRVSGKLTFRINGVFDYKVVMDLKKLATKQARTKAKEYVVDLKEVTYINSSAFGALIFIKEAFGASNEDISIVNPSPEVRKMLEVVNFHQLFKIV
jgi:HptB-dependent secretion and biofilm anti anti-sigma factor